MDFLIDFIVLPILCFVIVVLLLLFFASVYVYCTDEKYRKSMDAALESNKKYKVKRNDPHDWLYYARRNGLAPRK